MTPFHIGTAGWTYDDWAGNFYPDPPPRRFQPLPYYARYFNLVEVNATFYRVLPPRLADKWCHDVAERDDFRFAVKLWQGLTHERPAAPTLPQVAAIREMLDRLRERDRLAALLAQFPWSFKRDAEAMSYVARLLDLFPDTPCVVEMRHASWDAPDFLEFLRRHGAAFCNIDQPGISSNLSPTRHVTAPFAYLRVHGRNAANWFRESADGAARYDYYYRESELDELEAMARALAAQAEDVLVTTNNHYRGQAPANALALRARLEGQIDAVPGSLRAHYPELAALPARHRETPPISGKQGDLFDRTT